MHLDPVISDICFISLAYGLAGNLAVFYILLGMGLKPSPMAWAFAGGLYSNDVASSPIVGPRLRCFAVSAGIAMLIACVTVFWI